MVFGKSTFDLYLHQWLKTAAGGNVVAEFSLMESRYRATCLKCKESLVFEYSEASDTSQTFQKWVAGHRHSAVQKVKSTSSEETLVKRIFEDKDSALSSNILPAARRRKFR